MQSYLGALILLVLPLGLWEGSHTSSRPERSGNAVVIYDPNPAHLWNRLDSVLFVREDLPGSELVPDSLDPPLCFHTQYLLAKPSRERVVRVLDEFLQTHGERLIQDPVKRAILGHDLWAVFDWTVERQPSGPGKPAHDEEKRELQTRLAEVMRRLALTPEEIRSLPANYEQAAASGQFARVYDPANPDRPFLPPDLFDPRGPWIQIGSSGSIEPQPVAPVHAVAFSRSGFLIFLRLPAGRAATFDYLRTLWEFPQPWIPRPDEPDQTVENLHLPEFPVGTEVALVRQMMLFDNRGNLESTPIHRERADARVPHCYDKGRGSIQYWPGKRKKRAGFLRDQTQPSAVVRQTSEWPPHGRTQRTGVCDSEHRWS